MNCKDKITILRGPDRVRKRPAVFFDSDGIKGCSNAVINLLQIFVNEAFLGFCKKISLTVDSENIVTIKSFDRGFSLSEEIIEGNPSWYYDFCELYYPKTPTDEGYIFGLGREVNRLYGDNPKIYDQFDNDAFFDLTRVQYVSEFMEVKVSRDGIIKEIGFEKGYCITELTKQPTDEETYTQLRFKLDDSVFETNVVSEDLIIGFLKNAKEKQPDLLLDFNGKAFKKSSCNLYKSMIE